MSWNRWLERTPGLGADEFNFTEKYKVTLLSIADNFIRFCFVTTTFVNFVSILFLGDHIRHSEGEHGQD